MAEKIINSKYGEIGQSYVPNMSVNTTSKTNAQGEIINPTPQDVANFNAQYTTTTPTFNTNEVNAFADKYKTIVASQMNQPGANIGNNIDNTNYNGIVNAGNAGINAGSPPPPPQEKPVVEQPKSRLQTVLESLKGTETKPESQTDIYAQAEKEAGISALAQKERDLSAQLAAITAESQANRLSQEGRLTSIGTISGAQRDIERQTAIRALPVQAQLAAAQGNLQYAQDRLTTLFKLKSDDADRLYNYNKDLRTEAINLASEEDKAILLKQQKEEDRAFDLQKINMNAQNDFAKTALENGQGALFQKISGLDPKSPTYQKDLGILASQIKGKTTGSDLFGLLPVSTQNKIINSADEFNSKKEIQKFVATVDAANVLNIVDPNSKNPAEHQAIVYGFAKALDPESVVRGEEYEAVKKYSQSLFNKYKGEISNAIAGTGFLSPAAIADMQKAVANLYTARLPIYNNAYDEKARIINNIAGFDVAEKILEKKTGGYTQKQLGEYQNLSNDDLLSNVPGVKTNKEVIKEQTKDVSNKSFFSFFKF